jgi:hypothetical protein
MRNLNLQKIVIKKTKMSLIMDADYKDAYNERVSFKNLLAVSLLAGVSGNCFRQVLKEKLTKTFDFEKLENLQSKMNILIYEMVTELDRVELIDGIKYETTTFK